MASVVEGLPFSEEKKKYITEVLDPVLEEMVSDLLMEMPKSPLDFMISWLRKRCGMPHSNRVSVMQRNVMLKQELKQITGALEEAGTAIAGPTDTAPDKDEDEEEEDDDCDEIPESFKKSEQSMGKTRASVSAEAYGQWNQKKEFTPPQYPKTEDQTERLKKVLLKSFMFNSLEAADLDAILLAMQEVQFDAGQKAINEGEDGDYLFVIEKGSLDCKKIISGQEKIVKTCNPGDVFGELALLYNCPRAASVVAAQASICWKLDRDTFNHIVKDAAAARRLKYDEFLKNVALISSIEPYERSQIADALKSESFKKGDVIVKQADPGDKFYIVEEGSLYALKTTKLDGDKRVMDYKPGDYFGELALLKNQPRAASVIVQSEQAKVLSMSREAFSKMIGPLQHILARQSSYN